MKRHRSLAVPLLLAYVLLAVYATLYPFDGWRWPPGIGLVELVALPWSRYTSRFDQWANLLSYAPLGGLLFVAVLRTGGSLAAALGAGLLGPCALSFTLETTQQFLPNRVPSLRDWLLNSVGAAMGVALAWALQALGMFERWHALRERWFVAASAGAVALLVLWPVALLFPAPVPLGLGQVFDQLRELAEAAVDGTPWADALQELISPAGFQDAAPLAAAREGLGVALGLLAPATLAIVVTRSGWRRLVMVLGAVSIALAAMTLSTALNFGPEHALAWLTPATLPALATATLLAAPLCLAGPRVVAAIGLVVVTALVVLVAQAPADPYYAASLQSWEQGRFIRFHGMAQWVGWLWPYATMAWLLARLARRE